MKPEFNRNGMKLRLGRWQDVLNLPNECDVLMTDAPYSERTHAGERGTRLVGVKEQTYNPGNGAGERTRNGIDYDALTEELVREFTASWAPRTKHWAVIFGDDVTWRWWRDAWAAEGWTTFAPVIWVKANPPPRFSGDGPTSSCEYIMVARPRRRLEPGRTGSRPGHYNVLTQMGRDGKGTVLVGTKDLNGMRALVRDYATPGDLIADPFAGTGTTLLAAGIEGCKAIGAEVVEATYQAAVKRLRKPFTRDLFAATAVAHRQAQEALPLEVAP